MPNAMETNLSASIKYYTAKAAQNPPVDMALATRRLDGAVRGAVRAFAILMGQAVPAVDADLATDIPTALAGLAAAQAASPMDYNAFSRAMLVLQASTARAVAPPQPAPPPHAPAPPGIVDVSPPAPPPGDAGSMAKEPAVVVVVEPAVATTAATLEVPEVPVAADAAPAAAAEATEAQVPTPGHEG